jgi:hypothetical protein
MRPISLVNPERESFYETLRNSGDGYGPHPQFYNDV